MKDSPFFCASICYAKHINFSFYSPKKEHDKQYQEHLLTKEAIEADELEEYAERLVADQLKRGHKVYPIQKAKEKLGFESQGRPVLIASDASKIRIHPQTKDMFYKPQDSRDRLSINWT